MARLLYLASRGVEAAPIERGKPQQNDVERFNGTMRRQLLNGEELDPVLEAGGMIEHWVEEYNTQRPW